MHYNFDALNHSPTHPARARTDTFYVATEDMVLRTHTSPVQVRAMEAHPPPLYVVIPGRVYRPDSDATHTPQFHQIEGLAVDEDITLADLKGTLLAFARAVFGERARRAPAPALLPLHRALRRGRRLLLSLQGKGFLADGARCHLCKGEGWLEVLGAGEVDPNVYAHIPTTERNAPGYDPEQRAGLRVGHGHRADRDAQARDPRPAPLLRKRSALPGAVRMTCAFMAALDRRPQSLMCKAHYAPCVLGQLGLQRAGTRKCKGCR